MSAPEKSTRSPKNGPYCWQSKAARRKIREAFDATHDVASALSVYDALSEIASNKQSETFTISQAAIGECAGVSVRTAAPILEVLVEIGLIGIVKPIVRGNHTYTLFAFGNGCASFGNKCRTFGNGRFDPSLPTYEESQKNQEELEKNLTASPAAPSAAVEKPARPRNELFDALARACGSNPDEMTARQRKACGVALAEIVKACPNVKPSDFQSRAAYYRKTYRDAALTPSALCNHWSEYPKPLQAQAVPATIPEPHPEWRAIMRRHYEGSPLLEDGRTWDAQGTSRQTALLEAWARIPGGDRHP
ncbi:MAG: hypothetical protein WCA95_05115 [Opitutaceae bacterium]